MADPMTIHIGLCDDEEVFLNTMKDHMIKQLHSIDVNYELHVFDDGNKLLKSNEEIVFDLVFLDIEMPLLSGMEVAKKLRETNPYMHIIFVTNRDDLVFSSFQYRPLRYIRKQRVMEELPEAINHITQLIKNENQYYTVSINNSSKQIKVADIIYIESIKHDIYIHTQTEDIRIKSNLAKMEKDLSIHGFIRVHSGYIVNYRFIYSVNKGDIVLSNQASIPLSRHRAESVKQKLQLYASSTKR